MEKHRITLGVIEITKNELTRKSTSIESNN